MVEPGEYDRLAEEAQRGDPHALAELYRELGPPVLGYLERMLGDRSDAEDVLHDTFLRLFEGRRRYRGEGRFRSWLFTVATHLAVDRVRSRKRRRELLPRVRESLSPRSPPSPAERVITQETLRRVESVLYDLPPSYAVTFHLRVREGFSYGQIAAMTGEAQGTLRSRVHRALQQLRTALEPNEIEPRGSETRSETEKESEP